MKRFMWSFDGKKFSEAEALKFAHGERLRIVLVNDSMMTHPIHLHGMWSELESPDGAFQVRKHTILVQPAQRVSYLVTADALGRWAYHCHLLSPHGSRDVSRSDRGPRAPPSDGFLTSCLRNLYMQHSSSALIAMIFRGWSGDESPT